ncbi:hypothetical protein [Corynebacterium variabile]|uniref:hypothetical protein n=1 Tax=Corynebacterium variabile TaxID=1727 RepID=UPI003A93BBFA
MKKNRHNISAIAAVLGLALSVTACSVDDGADTFNSLVAQRDRTEQAAAEESAAAESRAAEASRQAEASRAAEASREAEASRAAQASRSAEASRSAAASRSRQAERDAAAAQQQQQQEPTEQWPSPPATPSGGGGPAMEWFPKGPFAYQSTCGQNSDQWPANVTECFKMSDGWYYYALRQAA